MCATLTQSLQNEANLSKIYARLEQCTPTEGVSFVLLQWIPCIMHMEIRVGIKILTMLSQGLAHTKGSSHPNYQQSSLKAREEEFYISINKVIIMKFWDQVLTNGNSNCQSKQVRQLVWAALLVQSQWKIPRYVLSLRIFKN